MSRVITDWPMEDRPREKLLDRGAETLSDAELLAIFLRTGSRGQTGAGAAPLPVTIIIDQVISIGDPVKHMPSHVANPIQTVYSDK